MTAPVQGANPVIPGVTPSGSPSATGNAATGVGSTPTTAAPAPTPSIAETGTTPTAPAIEAPSLATRCWNAVSGVVSGVVSAVWGTITWVWNCITSLFRSAITETTPAAPATATDMTPEARLAAHVSEISRADATNADRLVAFSSLLAAPNATGFEMDAAAVTAQMSAGYDALPEPLRTALNAQILIALNAPLPATAQAAVDDTAAAVDTMAAAVTTVHQGLPSVALGNMETRLTEATTDQERVGVLLEMRMIGENPLDADVTVAVLNTRMSAAFMGLEDALRDRIQGATWRAALNPVNDEQDGAVLGALPPVDVTITGGVLNTGNGDFGAAILAQDPRGAAVEAGLNRWVINNPVPTS